MGRYDDQMAGPGPFTCGVSADLRGYGAQDCATLKSSRTLTQQANELDGMTESALRKASEACIRMGRPNLPNACTPPPQEQQNLPRCLDSCEQQIKQLHDALDFILNTL